VVSSIRHAAAAVRACWPGNPATADRGLCGRIPFASCGVFADLAAEPVQGVREKIMERLDADDSGSQRGRNLRFAHVADVRDAIDLKVVNLGMEGALNLGRAAAEAMDMRSLLTWSTEKPRPVSQLVSVAISVCDGPKLAPTSARLEPVVEVGRLGVVLPQRIE